MLYFRKKGQLEIGITMMVLLVFMILLIISLVFYFKFSQESIKETRLEILDEKYSGLLDAIMGLPELRYSFNGVEKNCLDIDKIENFKEVVRKSVESRGSEYYNNLLGDVNSISVEVFDITLMTFKAPLFAYGAEGAGLIYSSPVSICEGNNIRNQNHGKLKQDKWRHLQVDASFGRPNLMGQPPPPSHTKSRNDPKRIGTQLLFDGGPAFASENCQQTLL